MKEIVTFFLSGKLYGVDVNRMQAIENYEEMIKMPGMPENLQGFISLRGDILPVIDIKKQFRLPQAEVTAETKYVILQTTQGKLVVVADGVSRIIKADGNDVQEFPKLLRTEATSYVEYIVKNENQLILAIDAENFLSEDAWKVIRELVAEIKAGGNDD